MEEQLAQMTVETVVRRWPETAVVFNHYGMACVGCAVASFYTVDDAISVYRVPRVAFLKALVAAIRSQEQEKA